ncbi:hypothetical protein AVEN_73544-1 [Araneus ventricosus]|uniref:Uncharacterized protein n=1 Tax=Araneus ventricosus TaxID=182803 RepID=A0A4Y2DVC8_ARAVE|nr:hypothetical protein AVEN_73544-1 [Araneus ventricosus]
MSLDTQGRLAGLKVSGWPWNPFMASVQEVESRTGLPGRGTASTFVGTLSQKIPSHEIKPAYLTPRAPPPTYPRNQILKSACNGPDHGGEIF